MKVEISTMLNAPTERIWQEIQRVKLLVSISAPVVIFEPVDPPQLPERWEERPYLVKMRLFKLIPFGKQTIDISLVSAVETPGAQMYQLRDNGHGEHIRTWDHMITISEPPGGGTRYTDSIEIHAGLLTPFVWLFAQLFYRHRQRGWRRLVRNGFRYS